MSRVNTPPSVSQPQQQTRPAQQNDNGASLLDKTLDATAAKLDQLASNYCFQAIEQHPHVRRALLMAQGIQKLREAITPDVMRVVIGLQGSRLGFKTDKDREGGYKPDVVKEVLIEALLRGVYPVGNEFNIIAGGCYVTREGFQRLVQELPGLTDLEETPGVPLMKNGGAVVPYRATYRVNGQLKTIEREIPVKVNQQSGVDAIIGKARRKMLAAIHQRVTGCSWSMPEGEIEEVPASVPAVPVAGRVSLRPEHTKPAEPWEAPGVMEPYREPVQNQEPQPAERQPGQEG